MECTQFQSVVALADFLVRSAHAKRSRVLLPSLPIPTSVSSKSLTDFSICSILGLENNVEQSSPGSGKIHSFSFTKTFLINQLSLKMTKILTEKFKNTPRLKFDENVLVICPAVQFGNWQFVNAYV